MANDAASGAPNTVPWPPILLGIGILVPVLLGRMVPVDVGLRIPALGIALIIAAFSIDAWVFELFRRHNTEIMPHKAASHLVTGGPFRYSRNPIYVGNALIIMGGFFLTGSLWFIAGAVFFVVAVTKLAIVREERHLAALFGEEWHAYAARVRRWI